ncbi:MAG: hypothetical protein KAF64_20695 [Hydrogenophaga sp.]|uniref:DUF7002 family protein n=1 Tax=Hydrogenophaga sp. TaxID=1904254 RepID=UPI0025C22FCC|nr:hypothetical protein [Hydrogenophaga sp.]MBU7575791.1 hypothetical protein [Hydrogenophaga sp.]
MAEKGTWESIRNRGLLSASAVLTHFKVSGEERRAMEAEQRPRKMEVGVGRPDSIVLRDQKPMPKERLAKALKDGTTPEEWYRLINSKVFFWAHEARLLTLLNARDYRSLEHDVLTIDTAPFVRAYSNRIWLCHMNSGNTWPIPHHRGKDVFKRIEAYPTNAKGNPLKPVAEVVVDDQAPNIADYVIEVRRMKGAQVLEKLV